MEKANCVNLMDKLIKEIGSMVKEMEKEKIVGLTDQLIKEIGRTIQ
jgi:hypothetical protein